MRWTARLAVITTGLLVLAACGSSSGSSGNGGSNYGGSSSTTKTTKAAPAAKGDATVSLASGGTVGEHLVGPNQHTLYLFEKDQGTTTACTGGCVAAWPALVADGTPTAGAGVHESQLGTATGAAPNQVTYHGHLLYYFAGDTAPGQTNGTSVPSWYAVDANGQAIEG